MGFKPVLQFKNKGIPYSVSLRKECVATDPPRFLLTTVCQSDHDQVVVRAYIRRSFHSYVLR